MTAASIMNLNINDKAHGYAKIYAALIQDEFQRKRAYASIVGLFSLVDALEKTDNEIQKNMTIFRNPHLNEKYEISDLYVNNWHIDVRIACEGNNVLVPKCHFDNDILPDFYAVIKLDKDLKNAELIGFADTVVLEKQPFDYHYYSVSFDSLISFEEFLVKVNNPKITNFDESEHEKFRSLYLSILDEEINIEDENKVLKHLFECSECRREFCCFTGFEMVNCNLGKYPELFEDKTLNIIGAQEADDEKYAGKEETIKFNEDRETLQYNDEEAQSTEEQTKDEKENDSSDILDELFSDDEESDEQTTADTSVDVNINQKNNENELEIIQDSNNSNNLEEVNDLMIKEESSPLEIIGGDTIDLPSIGSEVDLIEDNPDTNITYVDDDKSSELEIIDDNPSLEAANSDINTDNSEVQKVIVDYDEYGEPIYSYITNVPSEDNKQENYDAELSDYDILNEEFETYNPTENFDDDLINIKNGGVRTIEYVQNENEDAQTTLNTQSDENDDIKDVNETEIIENSSEEENPTKQEIEIEDYSEDTAPEIVYNDLAEEKSEVEPSEIIEYKETDNETSLEETEDETDGNEEFEEYSEDDEENEYEEYDDSQISDNSSSSSKKNFILLSAVIGIIAIASILGGVLISKNSKSAEQAPQIAQNNENIQIEQPQNNDMFEVPQNDNQMPNDQGNPPMNENPGNNFNPDQQGQNQNPEPMVPESGNINPPQLSENNLIQPQNPNTADANQAMTNAFAPGASNVSLRGLNWLCTPQLFTDNQFKSYLQNLDNLLKLNVRKNILNATDNPQNYNISVKMAVDNNGNLLKTVISDSSGSEQIDNIVLQSINETFQGEKSPILTDSPLKSDKYYLKVIIKL